MYLRTLSIKDDKVTAIFKEPGGYETDKDISKIAGLESGKTYSVTRVYIGTWNSTVVLEGLDGYEFNTVQFGFFINGKEVDIVSKYRYKLGC